MRVIVRDPVHGDIYFGPEERAVIDTPEIQRLRGIKQLGTGYFVYPGAVHTRFEHSLGTAAMAKRMLDEMHLKGHLSHKDHRKYSEIVSVLGIVHDVTHIPFGHTFEDEMHIFDRHDKRQRYEEFLSGTLGSILRNMGMDDMAVEYLSTHNVDELEEPWVMEITTHTICADFLDYLRRDAYYCGLNKDYDDRIFRYMSLYEDEGGRRRFYLNMTKHNMLRSDVRNEIIHLLRMRYTLTERVYLHHTKVIAGAMISKALAMAQDDMGVRKQDIYGHSDESLLAYLHDLDVGGGGIRRLIDRVRRRELLKRAYVLSPRTLPVDSGGWRQVVKRYHYDRAYRTKREREIAEELDVGEEEVIIYCMDLPKLKEAKVKVLTPEGYSTFDELPGMRELEHIKLQYKDLWRLYVFVPEDVRLKAGKIAEGVIGYENEFS